MIRGQGAGDRKAETEPRPLTPERGFTLVEVMLTIAILGIGIIGILRAYSAAITALEVSQYSMDAAGLLKERVAEFEQKCIEEDGLLPGIDKGEFEDRYKGFKWESEVNTLDLVVEKDLKEYLNEVKITVVNGQVKPVRRFSLVTTMENKIVNE